MDSNFKIMYVMAARFNDVLSQYKRIVTITVKDVNYSCIMYDISKSEAFHLLESFVLDDRGYIEKCISKKSTLKIESTTIILTISSKQKSETEKILIDEKNYKDLTIYFSKYVHSK